MCSVDLTENELSTFNNFGSFTPHRRGIIPMGLLLLIILVLLLVGGLPTWPYSRRWGYGPSGALGTLLMILLILVMLDYVPRGF
jgi:Protein of unknown function (DUF3309)